jgi:hypothetical protein
MDPFLDPYWNLDQICGWARTREPEVVRFAADGRRNTPGRTSLSIDVRAAHAVERAKQAGRDVNLELWNASGWPQPQSVYAAPAAIEQLSQELGVPVFRLYRDASIEVEFPQCGPTEAFLDAYASASEFEQQILISIFRAARPSEESTWLEGPAYWALSPQTQQLLAGYVNRAEVHGPYRVRRHAPFPIEDYLLRLFRQGALTAYANHPDDPFARVLTPADWGGLEIAIGGEHRRLSVWAIGHVGKATRGGFENVRVAREAVLSQFPVEPPANEGPASNDAARAVIRDALSLSGGFISQEKGAEIVRRKFPGFPKMRARQLVKELTGNDKPGPKGPRHPKSA